MTDLHLKFPIGTFTPPANYDQAVRNGFIATLQKFPFQVAALINACTEDQLRTPYRPGGWTIAQVVHHCADSHTQAFSRFKWALTEPTPTIKPYEEQLWAVLPDSQSIEVKNALYTLKGVHGRWVDLLTNMNENEFEKTFYHPGSQKMYSLNETLALYDWHSRHHLAHMQLVVGYIDPSVSTINYDGRRFKSIANVSSGEVDEATVFEYYQHGQTLQANYKGGQIVQGQMLGQVAPDGSLHFYYQHLNINGLYRSGICHSSPEILPNGKIRLHEKWTWLDAEKDQGESIVEEI